MIFKNIFLEIARQGLDVQDSRIGAMPAGRNGPYHDPETPVRNTAHWLQIFLTAFRWSGDAGFRSGAQSCARYLIGPDAPRGKRTFVHRHKAGKDRCNGLIGPAWTIEGLIAAFHGLEMEECLTVAEDLFRAHPFSDRSRLWFRVDPDGDILPEDSAFNHQLWFCMAGALLINAGAEAPRPAVMSFLEYLPKHLSVSSSGRIIHGILTPKIRLKNIVKAVIRPEFRKSGRLREVGYHAFNLYAFAVLYRMLPGLAFWQSRMFRSILDYVESSEFLGLIDHSTYGFPYNPPGFEIPFVHETFGMHVPAVTDQEWLQRQLDHLYEPLTRSLAKNNEDPPTLTARLYECCGFSEKIFSLPISVGEER